LVTRDVINEEYHSLGKWYNETTNLRAPRKICLTREVIKKYQKYEFKC